MAGGRSNAKKGPSKGGPSTPKSAFSSGKFKASPTFLKTLKKDNRHQLYICGLQAGVATAWVKCFNKEEEAFWGPYKRMLNDNPEKMEELGIAAIIKRKGADGKTYMPQAEGSEWPWNQMLFIVGEEENTPEKREELAGRLIADFNLHATTAMFQYPRKMRFGGDVTAEAMQPVDTMLLDADVINLMMSAYPDQNLQELSNIEEVMSAFWQVEEHGLEVIEEYGVDIVVQEGNNDA